MVARSVLVEKAVAASVLTHFEIDAMTRFIRDPKPSFPFAHIICACLSPLDVSDKAPGSAVQCACGQRWVVDGGWLDSVPYAGGLKANNEG